MEGKIVIITGASDGIGAEVARQLHIKGATVIIIGRTKKKTEAIAKELDAKYYLADFSKLVQVQELSSQLKDAYPKIDILINNAGGIFGKREVTVDGHEQTFQINHLAHFLLTTKLMDTLVKSKAIIINTSSIANKLFSDLDIDDLDLTKGYSSYKAYGNAKLENILFTKELHKRFHHQGISTAAVHPGNVATHFAYESGGLMRYIYHTPLKFLAGLITAQKGADTIVWLASSSPDSEWESGEYYFKRKVSKAKEEAYDPALANALWEKSEAMLKNV